MKRLSFICSLVLMLGIWITATVAIPSLKASLKEAGSFQEQVDKEDKEEKEERTDSLEDLVLSVHAGVHIIAGKTSGKEIKPHRPLVKKNLFSSAHRILPSAPSCERLCIFRI